MERTEENNQVTVIGEIISGFEFNHEVLGERFYRARIKTDRISGMADVLPILVSERLINEKQSYIGRCAEIKGQLRSYNLYEGGQSHLILLVFAKDLKIQETKNGHDNKIFLDGYICKKPVYRITPLGREIADVLLVVNRVYKSDYIPCICWGRNARYAGKLPVGSRIQLWGRIQSREYQKKISEDNIMNRTTYEVSVSRMEVQEAITVCTERTIGKRARSNT